MCTHTNSMAVFTHFNGWLVILDLVELNSGNYIMMLSLGKSLPPLSYQLVLSQTRQGPEKSWRLCGETEHTSELLFCSLFPVMSLQQSGQYRGLQLRTSWDPLFTNSTHSAVSIDHLCLSFTFSLFPFWLFFISNNCQIIVTSPMSLVSRTAGTNTSLLPHSFQGTKLDFPAAERALGKRFEATQLSRCAAAAEEHFSQQLPQLQLLPISEQQQCCSINVLDPTIGLLLLSHETIPYILPISFSFLLY